MTVAALIISCAAVAVCGYQLYWLRRLLIATRELRRLRSVRAAGASAADQIQWGRDYIWATYGGDR